MDQLKRERETTEPDPDMWRWSPLEIFEFARMLEVARSLAVDSAIRRHGRVAAMRRLSFGEAGSGIGTKLYLAKHMFNLDETGYEISEEYLTMSRVLGVHAEQCDLRTEKPPWDKFNIVYVARPLKSDPDEIALEQGIMDAILPGTVYMSAYTAVKPYNWTVHYRAPFRGVWVKAAPQYSQMILRSTTGSDPLVPEPGPRT